MMNEPHRWRFVPDLGPYAVQCVHVDDFVARALPGADTVGERSFQHCCRPDHLGPVGGTIRGRGKFVLLPSTYNAH